MLSRQNVKDSLSEAIRIRSIADAFEKLMYLVALVLGVAFLVFMVNLMGPKVFVLFVAAFLGLAMVKGLFVLLIK